MIRSMSGYGRGAADGEGIRVNVEVRSVNHRFCRVALHLPGELLFFESVARQRVTDRVERGKVDVTATVRGPRGAPSVQVNGELAASYKEALTELADALGVEAQLDLSMLASLPGVVTAQTSPELDPQRDLEVAESALRAALDALDEMRGAEGQHLATDVRSRFGEVRGMVDRIESATSDLPVRYRDILATRISTLTEETEGELDLGRLAQEVAYYADRSDITEELVRLRSHLDKAAALLDAAGVVGRSLEFLLQEMHREINTIGAKAKVVEIGALVVDVKSELERIREQVQNLE